MSERVEGPISRRAIGPAPYGTDSARYVILGRAMSALPLPYAALLLKPEYLQIPKMAAALARFKKIPLPDAAPMARACWGIVENGLDKEKAEELCARLAEAGLGGLAVPQNLLEEDIAALPLSKIEFLEGKLRAFLKSGEEKWIEFNSISLLAAAIFKKTTTTLVKTSDGPTAAQQAVNMGLMLATGIPIKVGAKKKETLKAVEQSDLVYYLDLCQLEPACRLRIDAQHFDFSCLKERMDYNIFGNFKTLISQAAQRTPGALKNKGALVILENKPIASMGYESLKDLEKESRWLLTLKILKQA